mmetsp:Transcript_7964/g.11435  ORF Transcript_7964/g.11435 Transcript_7964/m.11435 type:complete len:238 (+) Transcript_7964:138-851(+)
MGSSGSLLSQQGFRGNFFLGFHNSNNIIKRNLGSTKSLRIMRKHNSNPDSNNTLSHHNVTDGGIRVNLSSITGLDHVTISELHCLGTLSTKLSSDNNFATLGFGFHDETDNTVASTTDGKSSEKLEFQRFGLGLSAKTAVGNTFGVKFDGTIGKVETFLDDTGKFADALSLFSQHVLGAGGTDDNFSAVGSGTNFNTGITVLGEFAVEQLVEFGVKHTVRDKFALGGKAGATCGRHF